MCLLGVCELRLYALALQWREAVARVWASGGAGGGAGGGIKACGVQLGRCQVWRPPVGPAFIGQPCLRDRSVADFDPPLLGMVAALVIGWWTRHSRERDSSAVRALIMPQQLQYREAQAAEKSRSATLCRHTVACETHVIGGRTPSSSVLSSRSNIILLV